MGLQKVLSIGIDHGKFLAKLLGHDGLLRADFIPHLNGERFAVGFDRPSSVQAFKLLNVAKARSELFWAGRSIESAANEKSKTPNLSSSIIGSFLVVLN